MEFRPDVFISAAAIEMAPFRQAAKDALAEIGANPVEHLNTTVAYGPAHGVLNVAIGACEAVIHLAGFSYGAEPSERTLGAPRRSFPMFEVDVAQALGKTVLFFLAQRGAPVAPAPFEPAEVEELQHEHRHAIEHHREHWTFSTPQELAGLIRSLRPRIVVRRRLAQLTFAAWGQLPGRTRLLREVTESLETPGVVVLHPPPSRVTSSGSSGKTTLAVEVAWRLHEAGRFDFVFFIPADVQAEIEASVAALARTDALALLPDAIAEHRARLDAVRAWFRAPERAGRFLVILDGVDRQMTWWAVQAVLPWFDAGCVLITSRMPLSWKGARTFIVGSLAREDAVDFLAARLADGRSKASPPAGLDRLADAVERQPLALQLAAAAIAGTPVAPVQFAEQILSGSGGAARTAGESRMLSWQPVFAAVVERSLARLDTRARSLLHVLAALAPQPASIPFVIFGRGPEEDATREALAQLERQRLVTMDTTGRFIHVNRLLREVVRDKMSTASLAAALGTARGLIDAALPRGSSAAQTPGLLEKLLPHCRVLLGQLNGHPLELGAGPIARALAQWLRECRRSWEAEPFGRRAVLIAEKNHGANHPDIVRDLRVLGAILRELRRFDEAEKIYRRCLAILEKQPGADPTPDLYSLASCLRARNRLSQAEAPLRKVLLLETRRFGPHHRRTAIAEHTLGALLQAARRPLEAVELYRSALRTDECEFGGNHPRVAVRLHNLATALAAAGWPAEAIVRHRTALAIDEANLGRSHPDLAPVLKELAALLEAEGRLDDAETLLRRALAIDEKTAGPVHEDTAATLAWLAGLLKESGRAEEAEAAAFRALAIIEATDAGGPRHPFVRATSAGLRAFLHDAGRTPEEIAEQTAAAAGRLS